MPTGFTLHKFISPERKIMRETRDFTQNENRTLVMSPQTEITESHLFRTFSGLNILDLKALQYSIDQGLHTDMIDYKTFMANMDSLTFFQVFNTNIEFLELLEKMIATDGLDNMTNIDEFGEVSDNIIIRQLYWTLSANVTADHASDKTKFAI